MLANEKKLKNVLGAAGICAAAACVIASAGQTTVLAAENYTETTDAGSGAGVTIENLMEGSGASIVLSDSIIEDDDDSEIVLEAGAENVLSSAAEEDNTEEDSSSTEDSEVDNQEAEAAEDAQAEAESSEETAEADSQETADFSVSEVTTEENAENDAESEGSTEDSAESEDAEKAAEEAAKAEEAARAAEEAAKAEEEAARAAEEAAQKAAEEAAAQAAAEEAATESVDTAASAMLGNADYVALCKIVQAEAGSEPVQGKIAVANVIMNRINNPSFPSTVEDVIRQPGQFGPVRNGSYALAVPSVETMDAVNAALSGIDYSGGALYFKRSSSSKWGSRNIVNRVGNHAFYV